VQRSLACLEACASETPASRWAHLKRDFKRSWTRRRQRVCGSQRTNPRQKGLGRVAAVSGGPNHAGTTQRPAGTLMNRCSGSCSKGRFWRGKRVATFARPAGVGAWAVDVRGGRGGEPTNNFRSGCLRRAVLWGSGVSAVERRGLPLCGAHPDGCADPSAAGQECARRLARGAGGSSFRPTFVPSCCRKGERLRGFYPGRNPETRGTSTPPASGSGSSYDGEHRWLTAGEDGTLLACSHGVTCLLIPGPLRGRPPSPRASPPLETGSRGLPAAFLRPARSLPPSSPNSNDWQNSAAPAVWTKLSMRRLSRWPKVL